MFGWISFIRTEWKLPVSHHNGLKTPRNHVSGSVAVTWLLWKYLHNSMGAVCWDSEGKQTIVCIILEGIMSFLSSLFVYWPCFSHKSCSCFRLTNPEKRNFTPVNLHSEMSSWISRIAEQLLDSTEVIARWQSCILTWWHNKSNITG